MAKTNNATTIADYPIPYLPSTEYQVIADIISLPETLMEAERMIHPGMFSDEQCKQAYETLQQMSKEGMVIDLPSAYSRIGKDFLRNDILSCLGSVGGVQSAIQHFSVLKNMYIKRKCYFKALELLVGASDTGTSAQDLIGKVDSMAQRLRKEVDLDKSTQHISEVINDLGNQIEDTKKMKAEGKTLRVPTGFYTLNWLTYGGFNAGNLVILAARPSQGKTAVMLQMARAAASHGKTVNLFNLEMTNTELAQRFLFSTGKVTPLQMARGDVEWVDFEDASSEFASKPIYLNDSANTIEEIRSRIILNSQSGRCDIAFIDYLGLIRMTSSAKSNLSQVIAETTKSLKTLAKECRIPIVLLCQLNRASASEKRPPEMHDLRDSGGIEQDADIVLMLERVGETELNMWVRKNRQGKAGDIKVELDANETFTTFKDRAEPEPVVYRPVTNDFENTNNDFPF